MKFRLERLDPGQPDYELLWLAVLAATGLLAAAWLLSPLPTPPCLFHALTGLPCPTCGGTRCARSLLAGNFPAALGWNPLVVLLAAAAALYAGYALAVTALRLPRVRLRACSKTEEFRLRLLAAALLAANWLYLLFHFTRPA